MAGKKQPEDETLTQAETQIEAANAAIETELEAAAEDVKADVKKVAEDAKRLTHLLVRSVGASFRRAGRTWTRDAQIVAKELFTDEQIDALKSEKALNVTDVAAPKTGADA
jgi:hypothetical protein